MNTRRINEWLQITGTFGIIASLVFVGLQMKQSQKIALSATYQARTSTSVDVSIGSLGSPEFISGVAKVYSDEVDSLTVEEFIALKWEFDAYMQIYKNNHLQYELGFLPMDYWQKNVNAMRCFFEDPFYRSIRSTDFRETFAAVVDEIFEEATERPSGCQLIQIPPFVDR